jgi:hypothetical protein
MSSSADLLAMNIKPEATYIVVLAEQPACFTKTKVP